MALHDRPTLIVQRVADVRDDSHRIERLARRIRRARVRAPSALRARVPVEELPPRQLLDPVHPEPLRFFQVDFLQRAFRGQVHEERVHDREDDVHVLRVRDVREEREQEDDVGPPEHVPPHGRIEAGHHAVRDRRGERFPSGLIRGAARDVRRVVEEERNHDPEDEAQHDRRVAHPLVHEFLRPDHVAAVEGHAHPDCGEQRDCVLGEVQRTVQRDARDGRERNSPSRSERLGGDFDDARTEDHERPEDEGVEDARVPLPRDFPLEDSVDDEVLHARRDVVPPPHGALSREKVSHPEGELPSEGA